MTKKHDAIIQSLFYDGSDLDKNDAQTLLARHLNAADDGDLYLEHCESEYISRDDGRIRNAAYDCLHGFGVRGVKGDFCCLSHSSDFREDHLKTALSTIQGAIQGYDGVHDIHPVQSPATNAPDYYSPHNPLHDHGFDEKVTLLGEIDAFARANDPRVVQVSCSISGEWGAVSVLRPDADPVHDIRPLVRMDVSVVVEQNGIRETGFTAWGGRHDYSDFFKPETWKQAVHKAIKQAEVKLSAIPSPGGVMDVVMGPGWTGVMLHEAIGHGLEADFHARGSSVFGGMMGQQIAHEDVTVMDDSTVQHARGSLTCDDESTPGQATTLIENGRLVGLMTDRQSARLTGLPLTGNGRRESYRHKVMPRMTNTVMRPGPATREEMISQITDGLYARDFGGGQVDITSGQFVFEVSEAYRIRNGKIAEPVKGATLIGKGADALKKIRMVGADTELDKGIGICGKDGQSVPVGVGQPSLWMQGITVGGADV